MGVLAQGSSQGSGAVGRGPGDVPLTWGEEAPVDRERFEPTALAPGTFADPEQQGTTGVGLATPEEGAQHEAGGAAAFEASLGGSPWRRRLAPRHRRVVRELLGPGPESGTDAGTPSQESSPPATTKEESSKEEPSKEESSKEESSKEEPSKEETVR